MFLAQDDKCAICGCVETSRSRNGQTLKELAVDHDHVTGRTRALLCANCNHGLGHFKDDITRLQAAINYLESWKQNEHSQ